MCGDCAYMYTLKHTHTHTHTHTQLILPDGSDPNKDMFYPANTFDLKAYKQGCIDEFGESIKNLFDPMWMSRESDLSKATNVFFTNGLLDPWYPGGTCACVCVVSCMYQSHPCSCHYTHTHYTLHTITAQACPRKTTSLHPASQC
jgi:hypothetical protein